MTNANSAQWIKATESRRATPRSSRMRACLHAAVTTMQTCIKTFVTERHQRDVRGSARRVSQQPVQDRGHEQRVPGPIARVSATAGLAKIVAAALVVIAGVVALDLLVLWIAAGRLIERIPF